MAQAVEMKADAIKKVKDLKIELAQLKSEYQNAAEARDMLAKEKGDNADKLADIEAKDE